MEIGLTLNSAPPPRQDWWPDGAVIAADLRRNRFMRDGLPAAQSDVFGLTRAREALMPDAGTIYRHFPANTLRRINGLGALVEREAVNMQRSTGLLALEPQTLPQGWALDASGTTTEVLGTGIELGLPFIDLRIHGTPWAPFYNLLMSPPGDTPADPGQHWVCSFFIRQINGSLTGIETTRVVLYERDSGGDFLRGSEAHFALTAQSQRVSGVRTLDHSSVANVNAGFGMAITPDVPFDITLRLSAPQLERDRMTSPILTGPGSTGTRPGDSLSFAASGTHDWTIVYDDFSLQTFAGIIGDFSPHPAVLNRPLLRMVFAHPA